MPSLVFSTLGLGLRATDETIVTPDLIISPPSGLKLFIGDTIPSTGITALGVGQGFGGGSDAITFALRDAARVYTVFQTEHFFYPGNPYFPTTDSVTISNVVVTPVTSSAQFQYVIATVDTILAVVSSPGTGYALNSILWGTELIPVPVQDVLDAAALSAQQCSGFASSFTVAPCHQHC